MICPAEEKIMLEFKYDTQLLIDGKDLDEDVISDYFTGILFDIRRDI